MHARIFRLLHSTQYASRRRAVHLCRDSLLLKRPSLSSNLDIKNQARSVLSARRSCSEINVFVHSIRHFQLSYRRACTSRLSSHAKQNTTSDTNNILSGCSIVDPTRESDIDTVLQADQAKCNSENNTKKKFAAIRKLLSREANDQALDVYRITLKHNEKATYNTYSLLLTECQSAGAWQLALEILRDMESRLHTTTRDFYNKVIRSCEKDGELDTTLDLIQEMDRRELIDNHTQSAVTAVLKSPKARGDAVVYLNSTQEVSSTTRSLLYNAATNACYRTSEWEEGIQIYQTMRNNNIPIKDGTYASTLTAYRTVYRSSEAIEVLHDMQNDVTKLGYRTYIAACQVWQDIEPCGSPTAILDVMESRQFELGLFVYNTALVKCGVMGDWKAALDLKAEMDTKHITADIITYKAMVSSCIKEGKWSVALDALRAMQTAGYKPDVREYNKCIAACRWGQQPRVAAELIDEMHKNGVLPNWGCYAEAIKACGRAGERRLKMDLKIARDKLVKKPKGYRAKYRPPPKIR